MLEAVGTFLRFLDPSRWGAVMAPGMLWQSEPELGVVGIERPSPKSTDTHCQGTARGHWAAQLAGMGGDG